MKLEHIINVDFANLIHRSRDEKVTNEKYTVNKEGRWAIYYDHDDSEKDLIERIK